MRACRIVIVAITVMAIWMCERSFTFAAPVVVGLYLHYDLSDPVMSAIFVDFCLQTGISVLALVLVLWGSLATWYWLVRRQQRVERLKRFRR